MRKRFVSENVERKTSTALAVQSRRLVACTAAGTCCITEGLVQKGLPTIMIDQSEEMSTKIRRKSVDRCRINYRQGIGENPSIKDSAFAHAFADVYLHP